MGIKDSHELALQDWLGSRAGFDRDRRGPLAAAVGGGLRRLRRRREARLPARPRPASLPFVGWAERGDGRATGHGNSVPRFHLTWGTGPEVVRVFAEPVRGGRGRAGSSSSASGIRSTSCSSRTAPSSASAARCWPTTTPNAASHRPARQPATSSSAPRPSIVTSGGIGAQPRADPPNWPTDAARPRARAHDLRRARPRRRPDARRSPRRPAPASSTATGCGHYTEGIHNWDPIWPDHAIRIIPGPSSLWFDATGAPAAGMPTSPASTPSAR